MGRRSRFAITASLIAGALLWAPAQGAASYRIGSDLDGMNANEGCGTIAPTCTESFGSTPRFGDATSDGVITAWTVRENGLGAPEPVTLRVLHVVSPGTFLGVRSATPDVFPSVPIGVTPTVTFLTRLPISAGDRIGFDHSAMQSSCLIKPVGAATARWNPPLADGQQRASDGFPGGACEAPIQAIVEPDADRDGYGDETQDQCPTDASTHGPCPVPAAAGPTGLRAAALKKCKKKHSKHARRKCRKRAQRLPV